nr:hypothetical protein [Sagittula salina]
MRRWQEVLAGAGVVGLGLYWAFFSGGLLHWIGWGVAGLGVLWVFAGVQRARFAVGEDGPGVVQVVERRISYFGPSEGGILDLEALGSLVLDPGSEPPAWVLRAPGHDPLRIPLTAKGADQLFDAFASLPGIRTEHMLRHMETLAPGPVVIWRRGPAREAAIRLH